MAEAVCVKAFDKQLDLPYRALVVDERFKQRLLDNGHITDCLILDVLGELHEASNMPGLTAAERAIRRFHFSFLNFCLWGESLYLPSSNTGNDIFKKARGLVPDNLLAMHANCDSVKFLLERLPPRDRESYVDKVFSNVPDLENYFGLLVQKCGYKPAPIVAEGAFVGVDALATIKATSGRGFHIVQSRTKHYDSSELAARVVAAWNDGSRIDPASAGYKAYVDDLASRAEAKVERRTATVRERYRVAA